MFKENEPGNLLLAAFLKHIVLFVCGDYQQSSQGCLGILTVQSQPGAASVLWRICLWRFVKLNKCIFSKHVAGCSFCSAACPAVFSWPSSHGTPEGKVPVQCSLETFKELVLCAEVWADAAQEDILCPRTSLDSDFGEQYCSSLPKRCCFWAALQLKHPTLHGRVAAGLKGSQSFVVSLCYFSLCVLCLRGQVL